MLRLPKGEGIPQMVVARGKCVAVSRPATSYRLQGRGLQAELLFPRAHPRRRVTEPTREGVRSQILSHLQVAALGCSLSSRLEVLMHEEVWCLSCLQAGWHALNPAAPGSEGVVRLSPRPGWHGHPIAAAATGGGGRHGRFCTLMGHLEGGSS